jgi:hypothetical protein
MQGLIGPLTDFGITSLSTTWTMAREREPETATFGIDANIMTIRRDRNSARWCDWNTLPDQFPGGPICGIHWPNLLHPDPTRNDEVIARWVKWLREAGQAAGRMLAYDSRDTATQLAYHEGTRIQRQGQAFTLDLQQVDAWGIRDLNDHFVVDVAPSWAEPVTVQGAQLTNSERSPQRVRLRLLRESGSALVRLHAHG